VKPNVTARLACGCRVAFQESAPGSPVTVVLDRKAETCTVAIHVGSMPLYDHHTVTRPFTRFNPPLQPDYEDG
jgi:hypothetical protein